MDELGEWLRGCMDDFDQMTPIERLEYREELDRLVAEGHVIIVHGYKSKGKSYLVDWLPIKQEDTGHDDDSEGTT